MKLSSYRSHASESETRSQNGQQMNESMQEFKNLLVQWKNEIFEEVRNSMNECGLKIQRNQETMDMIKQHLKVNSHSINEIDSRFLDYETKLINLEQLIEDRNSPNYEISKKQDLNETKSAIDFNIISATLSKYMQLTEDLSTNFEKYKAHQSEESNGRLRTLQNELNQVIESRLVMINEQRKSDNEEIMRLKSDLDIKFQASSQSLNDQISALQLMIDSFIKETQSNTFPDSQIFIIDSN